MLSDFFSLFYPVCCAACGQLLYKHEQHVCNYCYLHLPRTHYHMREDNPVARLFSGRVNIRAACSYYRFTRSGKVQKLLHALKYKNKPEIGQTLGYWYGEELKKYPLFGSVELIIPVPLHRNKLKRRGYNQSAAFAGGLSESMNVPVSENALERIRYTDTQTRKNRFERWKNVEDKFRLTQPEQIKNRKILLVDDVVTTGATLEACIIALNEGGATEISIATISYAVQTGV